MGGLARRKCGPDVRRAVLRYLCSNRVGRLGWPASRRPRLTLRIYGAHDADGDTVRIFDDGVARAPESIVRRCKRGVACASELLVEAVYIVPCSDTEPEHDAAQEVGAGAPTLVPYPCKRSTIQLQPEPVRGLPIRMKLIAGMVVARVGKINPEPRIEIQ